MQIASHELKGRSYGDSLAKASRRFGCNNKWKEQKAVTADKKRNMESWTVQSKHNMEL